MSDAAIHPVRFVLSDMDGTLLRPDHTPTQRTLDTVRALRAAGVLFSLASGRPPKAMLRMIEAFGIDVPVAGFNGGTLVNPDGTVLVAHYLPAEAALVTLALFSGVPDVEVWVFADGEWLRRDPSGPMVAVEAAGLGYGPRVVESFEPYLDRVDKIVAASRNAPLLVELEAQLQPKVQGLAQVSRSQPIYLLAISNDALLTTKIKAQMLTDNAIPGSRIKVVTDNGIVYLMGLLTQAEATRAANLVQGVSGVQKIVKVFEYID